MTKALIVDFGSDEDRVWWKSSRSGGASNDCVCWAHQGEGIGLRDSKLGASGPVLEVSNRADAMALRNFLLR